MTVFSVGDLVATLRVNETQFDQVMSSAPAKAKATGDAIDKSMRGAKGALEGAAGGAASAANAIGAVAPASEKASKAAQLAAAKMQDSYRTAGLGVSTVTASNAREWENAAATAEASGSRMGAAASRAGSLIGLAIGAGVVIAGKAILSLGMDYEVSLNTLQAVSGASAAKMGEVSAAAKALGNDLQVPGQSAADAASAMTALAKSGLSVDAAMGAAKATLQLATAAQISGAQAAEIQAGALQQFGLAASDANKVADVLANTANASSGEITDFAAGMSQAGLVAHGLGISLEDTATTLGIFANQGLRGSDAGTSLKTMLIALERPTTQQAAALTELGVKAFDANGKFVGMKTVVDELGKAHGRMTTEQYNSAAATAFGTDAVRAATAIAAGGVTAFESMATSVGKAGGAATLAAAQTKGVTGALGNFQNNLENIALTIYEKYAPAIESMLNSAAAALPAIGNFFMGTVGVVGKFIGLITDIPGPVWALAAAFGAVAVLKGPVGAAFTGITSAITSFASHMDVARQSSVLMVNAGEKQLPGAMRTMATAAKSAGSALSSAFGGPLGIAIGGIAFAISQVGSQMSDLSLPTGDFSAAVDDLTHKVSALKLIEMMPADQVKALQDAKIGVQEWAGALSGSKSDLESVRVKLLDYTAGQNANNDTFTKGIDLINSFGAQLGAVGTAQDAAAAKAKALNDALVAGFQDTDKSNAVATAQAMAGAFADAGTSAAGAVDSVKHLGGAWADGSISASELTTQVGNVMQALDQLAGRNGDAEAAQRAFNKSVRDYGQAGIDQAKEATDFNRLLQDQTTATDDLAAAKDKALSKTYTETDRAKAVEAATRRVEDANNAVASATIQTGKAADEAAAKTAALKSEFVTTGQNAYNLAVHQGNLAGATAAATAALEASKQKFIDMQPAADKASGAAQILADKLFGIPAVTAAEVTLAGGGQVEGMIKGVLGWIALLPKAIPIDVNFTAKYIGNFGSSSVISGARHYKGGLPGYADGGGLLPGTPPADPSMDNLLALGPNGQPLMLRSREFIQPEPAVDFYGISVMRAMQQRRIPKSAFQGFASGGILAAQAPVLAASPFSQGGGDTAGLRTEINGLRSAIAQMGKTGASYHIELNHYGQGEYVPEAVVRALKEYERTHV